MGDIQSSNAEFTTVTTSTLVANVSIAVGNVTINTTSINSTSHTITSNTLSLGASSAAANGYTYLPNGLLLQWGTSTANSTVGSITFPIVFPTNCFSLTLTPNGQILVLSAVPTTTGCSAVRNINSATTQQFFWMAIGN